MYASARIGLPSCGGRRFGTRPKRPMVGEAAVRKFSYHLWQLRVRYEAKNKTLLGAWVGEVGNVHVEHDFGIEDDRFGVGLIESNQIQKTVSEDTAA